jgi:hypothetical protein
MHIKEPVDYALGLMVIDVYVKLPARYVALSDDWWSCDHLASQQSSQSFIILYFCKLGLQRLF